MVLTYSSSTQEVRQKGSQVLGQSGLHNEFKGSLSDILKLHLKKTNLVYHAEAHKYKTEKRHLAFHIGTEIPNSGPHACMKVFSSVISSVSYI